MRMFRRYADAILQSGERFMIDVTTYHQYARRKKKTNEYISGDRAITERKADDDDITSEIMAIDTPPEGLTSLLFPAKIVGYHLRRKIWGE